MKKLAKLKLQNVSVLDAPQMQALKGGRKSCTLRCNQDYQGGGIPVPDCARATAEKYCGENLNNTVCVCS